MRNMFEARAKVLEDGGDGVSGAQVAHGDIMVSEIQDTFVFCLVYYVDVGEGLPGSLQDEAPSSNPDLDDMNSADGAARKRLFLIFNTSGEGCDQIGLTGCREMDETTHLASEPGGAYDEWYDGWGDSLETLRVQHADEGSDGSTATARNLYGAATSDTDCHGELIESDLHALGGTQNTSHYNRLQPGHFTKGSSVSLVTDLMCIEGDDVGESATATPVWSAAGSDWTLSSITINVAGTGYDNAFLPTAYLKNSAPTSPSEAAVIGAVTLSSDGVGSIAVTSGGNYTTSNKNVGAIEIQSMTRIPSYTMGLRELRFDSCGRLLGISRVLKGETIACSGTD